MIKNYRAILLLGTAVLASSCTPTIAKRGNLLEDTQIQQIVPGVHTRKDALSILGSPTTQSPFDDKIWYYIGQETEKSGILDPEITKERIVALTFREDGTIKTIGDIAPNRIDVPVDSHATPTHGNQITVLQQFLGNIGKFNKSSEASR
jgi:outer membrane protein assembly factor BamE (lipoprotein component of BamABCDE complex)